MVRIVNCPLPNCQPLKSKHCLPLYALPEIGIPDSIALILSRYHLPFHPLWLSTLP